MSASLVPDRTYLIFNIKNKRSVANLIGGHPYAGITGITLSSSNATSKWKVKNLGDNQITLESVAAPGFYAIASIYLDSVSITASPNPTIWTLVEADKPGHYRITVTSDGKEYFWFLPGTADHVAIILRSGADDDQARWGFEPIR